ncbi:MAG: LysM peptidoglycan-binding domain-containing protein, partial [Chloroflexi bacterium]|nr:LysM peptidoglycan-binding domain-containing protein [Chloroflexota bacterium]
MNRRVVARLFTLVAVLALSLSPQAALAQPSADPDPEYETDDVIYTVARGDTLREIAVAHNVSIEAIIAANNLANPNMIYAGQQLIIPQATVEVGDTVSPTGTHVVQVGEQLGRIAQQYGVTLSDLLALNNIPNPDQIEVGQVL